MYHLSNRIIRSGTDLTLGVYGERIRRSDFVEQHYQQHIKEEVFEQVRKAYYPEAPSRFNAVFLFPDFATAKAFYAHTYHYEYYLYEVELAEGVLPFMAEMNLLNCDGLSFEDIQSNAHKYWQQLQHPQSGSIEVIFSGKATVKKMLLSPSEI